MRQQGTEDAEQNVIFVGCEESSVDEGTTGPSQGPEGYALERNRRGDT